MAELKRIIGGHITLLPDPPRDSMFQCFLTNTHGHFADSRIEAWTKSGIRFPRSDGIGRIVHASYVTFPWSQTAETHQRSVADIRIASRCAGILGMWGLNVHLPKEYHLSADFEHRIEECFEACEHPCALLFEIVGSSTLYVSKGEMPVLPIDRMKECQKVIERVALRMGRRRDQWGFCFDTAHAFVQGQPLSAEADVEAMLSQCGPNGVHLAAFHLNGSKFPFRSGRDQHAIPMSAADYIWSKDHSGLSRLVQWIVDHRIPTVMEIPGHGSPPDYDVELSQLHALLVERKKKN